MNNQHSHIIFRILERNEAEEIQKAFNVEPKVELGIVTLVEMHP